MARALLTLSGLQLAATCPSAPVLPRIGSTSARADVGSALHDINAARGEGCDVDIGDVADRWNLEGKDRAVFFARARSLDLGIPEGAVFEVPLCLRADGSVVSAVGERGSYDVPDDALVAGTLDILFASPDPLANGRWCEPESVLWAVDLKTGKDAYVAPIAKNWQARASALLGARWARAEGVVPGIVFPGPDGGTWDVPMRHGKALPLFPEDLAGIERDLRALAANVAEQAASVDEGNLPRLVAGAHCTYCPARTACPAHVAEARSLIEGRVDLAPTGLTAAQAQRGAGLLGPVKSAAEALEGALRAYVEVHGPIVLPDGRVYGPQASTKTTYSTRALRDALVAELTPSVGRFEAENFADLAFRGTREGIYDAIRGAHEAAGIRRRMKEAFERVTGAEGVSESLAAERWGTHYPKETI